MNHSFNLVDESWIPCQLLDGSNAEYGLSRLLIKAHEIRSIRCDFPMEKVALFRVLLAVLHRNFGPDDRVHWQQMWQAKKFDDEGIAAYFDEWHHRFYLFDQDFPFYQTNKINESSRPIIEFRYHLAMFHIAGGNNATLFDHHTITDEIVLSPSQSARMLVTAQSFAFGFLDYSDGPLARGINFLARGANLFETLMLNMIRYDKQHPFKILRDDLPAWEREDPFTPDRNKPDGYLDYLTWHCRRVLLHPAHDGSTVSSVQVDNGLKMDVNGEPYTRNPMMGYKKVENPAQGAGAYRPFKFQEGKSLWRDSSAILGTNMTETEAPAALKWLAECQFGQKVLQIRSIGISSGPAIGKINFYLEELFSFPTEYLENINLVADLDTGLRKAEEAGKKLWGAVNQLADIIISSDADRKDGRKADPRDKQQLMDHIFSEGQYWAHLETPFYRLLFDLPEKGAQAMDAWERDVRAAAWYAFDFARERVGNSPQALKAAALGGRVLASGLNKMFAE